MGRIERNGECDKCSGRIRYYPPGELVIEGASPAGGYWVHLDARDWLTDAHAPEPTAATLAKAELA